LRGGRSGVRRIQSFDPSALPTQFGGEVVGFDARNYLEKKDRKRLNVMVAPSSSPWPPPSSRSTTPAWTSSSSIRRGSASSLAPR